MSDSFLGEIRMFAGNYPPQGWALCDGSLLNISQYDMLYSLLDTIYGGDGTTTFGLPDLRSRVPVNMDGAHPLGRPGGQEKVTVTTPQMQGHTHPLMATTTGSSNAPAGNYLSTAASSQQGVNVYTTLTAAPVALSSASITPAPGGTSGGAVLPHDNIQPYRCINFIISLAGQYPSRS